MRTFLSALALMGAALGFVWGLLAWQDNRPMPAQVAYPRRPPETVPVGPVRLTDITQQAGIRFQHNNGSFGAKWIIESLGSGAAFFDCDNDGDADLLLVNSRNWKESERQAYLQEAGREHSRKYNFKTPPNRPPARTTCALFRNNGDGTFNDITALSGLNIEMYGLGVAAGDFDSDGKTDLFITALDGNFLFQNESAGDRIHFRDVTRRYGLRGRGLSTSAAWLDYDRDGRLDLFVCRYVKWSPAQETPFTRSSLGKAYSGPSEYKSDVNALYRNTGSRFQDVSQQAGIAVRLSSSAKGQRKDAQPITSNALGVVIYDFDHDNWPDIAVASDLTPNLLFRNNGKGTFEEIATRANMVYSKSGAIRAGMGIDAADMEGTGDDSLIIGHFSHESMGVFRAKYQKGHEVLYDDVAHDYRIIRSTERFVTFGCLFADIDNDKQLDILAANGHVRDDADKDPLYIDHGHITYEQRPLFLWNRGVEKPFEDVGFENNQPQPEIVGRGLACADIDLDGDVDMLFTSLNGPPLLLRNEGTENKSVRLTLEGTKSNRSAIGATVEAHVGTQILRRRVKSGASYLSQSELPLTIGLGKAARITKLLIHWPSGARTELKNIAAGQDVTVRENQGIVKQKPLKADHSP